MAYIFGYPEGTVMPNGNMTRAEAAAMISRLKNYPLADSSEPKFTDTPSGWYNAVNPITRAEAATILNRMFERKVTEEGMRKHRNEIHKFTDLTTEHWGYYELVEAANSHVYVRMRKGQ